MRVFFLLEHACCDDVIDVVQVQPDGDNSKDSTDSHLSTGNVTRASRLRNKQAANQLQDDEPIPARETRRKAMLKERVSAKGDDSC